MLEIRGLAARGLKPFDLNLDPGECIVVTGRSGAGKTVLLRAIADLDPNVGEITLCGKSRAAVPAPAWRRKVGYLQAEPAWWADRVGEHFLARPEDLISSLGLPRAAFEWHVARLSTGERQRLAFARMLERNPQVLLLDEPTAALDAEATERLESLLRARLADGAAALVVSHGADQAARLAHRRLHVEDGQVTEAAVE